MRLDKDKYFKDAKRKIIVELYEESGDVWKFKIKTKKLKKKKQEDKCVYWICETMGKKMHEEKYQLIKGDVPDYVYMYYMIICVLTCSFVKFRIDNIRIVFREGFEMETKDKDLELALRGIKKIDKMIKRVDNSNGDKLEEAGELKVIEESEVIKDG